MTPIVFAGLGLATAAAVALFVFARMQRRILRQSRQIEARDRLFHATFEQAVVGVAHLDLKGRWIRVNERLCEIAGRSRDALLAITVDDVTHPDDLPADRAAREAMMAGTRDHSAVEKRYIRGDGSIVWVRATRSTVRDADGRPDFFVAVVEEITARKEAELKLTTGEAQYRAVFDSAIEAMAVIDAKGTIQSVNPALVETFGYAPEELLGRNIKMLMPRSIAAQHDFYLRRYRDTGAKAIIGIGREVVGRRKDGSVFPLDLSIAEWQREGATFFTGAMRDASARKDAEAALRASEEQLLLLQNEFAHLARVNDLGEMAAAIAHEVNQPLTAVVNYLDTGVAIAADGFTEDGFAEVGDLIGYASEQALRAGDIVRRLREFIGHDHAARNVENVEQLVDAAMALALIDAPSSGITVERRKEAPGAMVEVDGVQIQQVLVNLMRNALDALRTAPGECELRLVVSTAIRSDGSVEVGVEDNGPGIHPEIAERVFEPFVTTKSNGMGMGLSVCRRLIESHGGAIEAENRPGSGAIFRFHLPHFRAKSH